MFLPYRELERRQDCFISMGIKPRLPMNRWQKIKAFLLGRVFKRVDNR